jgi:uncharacterized membrane protein (UPF0136 family)
MVKYLYLFFAGVMFFLAHFWFQVHGNKGMGITFTIFGIILLLGFFVERIKSKKKDRNTGT